jgi:hypothetical protein
MAPTSSRPQIAVGPIVCANARRDRGYGGLSNDLLFASTSMVEIANKDTKPSSPAMAAAGKAHERDLGAAETAKAPASAPAMGPVNKPRGGRGAGVSADCGFALVQRSFVPLFRITSSGALTQTFGSESWARGLLSLMCALSASGATGMERFVMDKQGLKTQIGVSLSLDVVRRAAAAYEMIKSANLLLEMLPISALEALRDYAADKLKCRNGRMVLCERHYVEHLDELIEQTRADERRLLYGITGIVPPKPDEADKPP